MIFIDTELHARYKALKISEKHEANKKQELSTEVGNIPQFIVQASIVNNTKYPMVISGEGAGNTLTPVNPNSTYSWRSTDTYNTKEIKFMDTDGKTVFLLGEVNFGPTAGVYVDRGWMATQTIEMVAKVTPTEGETATFTQSTDGGKTIIPWDGFVNGGIIDLQFSMIGTAIF